MPLPARTPDVRAGQGLRPAGWPPRARRGGLTGLLGLSLAALLLGPTLATAEPGRASDSGRDAGAAYEGSSIDGSDGEIDLARHGGRLTLVHFWATWCEPCKDELAEVAAFYRGPYRALARRGLALVTVSVDPRRRDLERFLEEHPLPFPVFLDSLGGLKDELGVWGLPGTVVLGEERQVVERFFGVQDWRSREFVERIEGHLEQTTAGAEPRAGKGGA